MDGDDNYMFWVVRVNDLFMANNKRWKHDCWGNGIRQHKKILSRVSGKGKRNTICEEQMCT